MAEGKNYYIKVPGALVEVTEEVYLTYYCMRRRCSAVQEKDTYNGMTSYDALDTEDMLGVDNIPDSKSAGLIPRVGSSPTTGTIENARFPGFGEPGFSYRFCRFSPVVLSYAIAIRGRAGCRGRC